MRLPRKEAEALLPSLEERTIRSFGEMLYIGPAIVAGVLYKLAALSFFSNPALLIVCTAAVFSCHFWLHMRLRRLIVRYIKSIERVDTRKSGWQIFVLAAILSLAFGFFCWGGVI